MLFPLQYKKQKFREIVLFAQGLSAQKWHSQHLNLTVPIEACVPFISLFIHSLNKPQGSTQVPHTSEALPVGAS